MKLYHKRQVIIRKFFRILFPLQELIRSNEIKFEDH